MKSTLLTAITFFVLRCISFSQAGILDTTFDKDGKTATAVGYLSYCYDMSIQSDGKPVLAGSGVDMMNKADFSLVRYQTNGKLDKSFGEKGIATIPSIRLQSYRGWAVAIQTDGKIVEVGDANIARFKANGVLDSSFGTNGIVNISPGYAAIALTLQSDDEIIISGELGTGLFVARYKTNGTLDMHFGVQGYCILNDFYSDENALCVQPDGKILIGGREKSKSYFAVARVKGNGVIDSAFGTNGITVAGNNTGYSNALAQQGKKIVAVGNIGGTAAVVRFKFNGALDKSFDTDGIKTISDTVFANTVVIQPNGKILVGGYEYYNSDALSKFYLSRYDTNGILDFSFGNKGVKITAFTNSNSNITWKIALFNDKIYSAGKTNLNNYPHYACLRYNNDETGKPVLNNKNAIKLANINLYPNPVKNVLIITGLLPNEIFLY